MSDDDDPDNSHHRLKILLAFAAVYVIWGSTYLAIRVGVRSLPPFLMSGCRFVVAGGLLFTLVSALGARMPTRAEWGHAGIAGVLMLTGGNGLVTLAEKDVPSNLTALLVAVVPLHMALIDWARPGGVRPTRRVLVGVGIGAAGMALLVSGGRATAHAASALAIGAILVSSVCWAAGSLYSRYASQHPHSVMAAAQQMIVGGTVMLAISVVRGEPQLLSRTGVTSESLLALAYLTFIGSFVAFSAFGWLVRATTPARLSTVAYVNPMVAVILGWALLGERLGPRALAGSALILGAVVVMTLPRRLLRG